MALSTYLANWPTKRSFVRGPTGRGRERRSHIDPPEHRQLITQIYVPIVHCLRSRDPSGAEARTRQGGHDEKYQRRKEYSKDTIRWRRAEKRIGCNSTRKPKATRHQGGPPAGTAPPASDIVCPSTSFSLLHFPRSLSFTLEFVFFLAMVNSIERETEREKEKLRHHRHHRHNVFGISEVSTTKLFTSHVSLFTIPITMPWNFSAKNQNQFCAA